MLLARLVLRRHDGLVDFVLAALRDVLDFCGGHQGGREDRVLYERGLLNLPDYAAALDVLVLLPRRVELPLLVEGD